jgi:UDP-N-acetylglucosamine 3-dehydrogenase
VPRQELIQVPETSALKAAVIGAGTMGYNHVRVYADMDAVELVAVADPSHTAARRVAHTFRRSAYDDFRQMLDREKPDLVSIAVPTDRHAEVASEAITRGIHVLVEKPLALTAEEGRRLIELARQHGVRLMVGHIERFNPAIRAIKERLARQELGRLFQVHSRRLSPFPNRIQDVGVVLDLATHEIDAMRFLLGDEIERIYAETDRRIHATHEDSLCALLRFRSGVLGVLDVNWLTPTKVRQLSLLGEQGMYVVDYLTQDAFFFKNAAGDGNGDFGELFGGPREGEMIKLIFPKKEPLRVQLESFVAAVAEGRPPEVSGEDGLAALEIAQDLIRSGREHCSMIRESAL